MPLIWHLNLMVFSGSLPCHVPHAVHVGKVMPSIPILRRHPVRHHNELLGLHHDEGSAVDLREDGPHHAPQHLVVQHQGMHQELYHPVIVDWWPVVSPLASLVKVELSI